MDYEVGDTVYEFPDDLSQQEVITILRQQGILPGIPARPAPPTPEPIAAIPPAAELAQAREQAAQAAAVQELEARQAFIKEGDIAGERARLLERERAKQAREAQRVIQPGREEPRRVDPEGFPMFRPSAIIEEEIPAVLQGR